VQRLLALDLDGTTVDDRGFLLPETMQSLETARRNQTLVCFVTGRCEFEMTSVSSFLAYADFLCINNGSKVTDLRTNEVLLHKCVNALEARQVIELALNKGFLLHVKAGLFWGVNLFDATVQKFAEFAEQTPHVYRSPDEVPLNQIDGFSITSSHACHEIDKLIAQKGLDLYTLPSQVNYYDVMQNRINKWVAVSLVARHLNLPVKNIIAVGDYTNDIEMIRGAGIGIAVQNANEDAKAAADYISSRTNNHNAIGEIVAKFILQNAIET